VVLEITVTGVRLDGHTAAPLVTFGLTLLGVQFQVDDIVAIAIGIDGIPVFAFDS
jgi:hypothetical protein